ncbi:metal ABC transporter ATP-binding protein [Corynebacterium caspium]|uniref:metal ABC transporter ATP-binding protein n=1 Tax=Corynebacterium caspium TaxID=234828 RepID=UPI000379AD8A|nr:metal ABC transporter ATP-binding protein [Corynebacterium caspium]WKD59569.1 High-affinity zinc uptake system ATP-binding protein ZnuC [Corynebacterium caspium DSM 44850]
MTIAVDIKDVSVHYGDVCGLAKSSLQLHFGTINGIIGQNGSGKSTLFKAITGSAELTTGTITVADSHAIAYVPQSETVDWNFPLSVQEIVMMGRYGHMNFLRRPSKEDKEAVSIALDRTKMSEFRHRQIGQLSGGQKKRAFVARGLSQDARIILLDEPFAGVDTTTEQMLIELLKELAADGCCIVIVTHDVAGVENLCDTVTVLNRSIIAHGTPKEALTREILIKAFGRNIADKEA